MVLRIKEGGTGQVTAPGARIALGLSDQEIIDIVAPSFGGPYQPLDSDLTAIAALATTTFGRAFLTLVDGPAALTYIGAAPAGSYQPLDSDLTAIAALTTTSFGRSFLDRVDAAAARTLLGLGTMATETASTYLTVATAAATYLPLTGGTISGAIQRSGTTATDRVGLGLQTAGSQRFDINLSNDAETGFDAGSDFEIRRYSDAGAYINTPLKIHRGANTIQVDGPFQVLGTSTSNFGGQLSAPSLTLGTGGTGGFINFPPTQIPSAGANNLDDYEEGTWTPALDFTAGSVGITYSARSGSYVKIGKLVHVGMRIQLTSKGSSVGLARILGLPFAVGGSQTEMVATPSYWAAFSTSVAPTAYFAGTFMQITSIVPGGNTAHLGNTDFGNSSDLIMSGTYYV